MMDSPNYGKPTPPRQPQATMTTGRAIGKILGGIGLLLAAATLASYSITGHSLFASHASSSPTITCTTSPDGLTSSCTSH